MLSNLLQQGNRKGERLREMKEGGQAGSHWSLILSAAAEEEEEEGDLPHICLQGADAGPRQTAPTPPLPPRVVHYVQPPTRTFSQDEH